MDQRCPSPPTITEAQADAQRIADPTADESRNERSFDEQPKGSYSHQVSDAEHESRTSGGTSQHMNHYTTQVGYYLLVTLAAAAALAPSRRLGLGPTSRVDGVLSVYM